MRTGPFVTHLVSPLEKIAENIYLLYQDFPLEMAGFADFHVALKKPTNLRRWFHPQAECFLNGENYFSPLSIDHAFAMFESVLNWAIYTNVYNYLIIHAAAVERGGYAAILPAPPGSGKSTLCAALVNRGWRLLTDELTMLCPQTKAIVSLARPVSLKNDAIQIMREFAPNAIFAPEIHNTIKGTIAYMRSPRDSVMRMQESALPGWMIFPKYEADAVMAARPLGKAEAFTRLPAGLVNYPILGELGFNLLTRLIDRTDCYEFCYSNLDEAIAWFEQLRPPKEYPRAAAMTLAAT